MGLLYVLLGVKVLIDRKSKAGSDYDGEEGAPLTGAGGSGSSVAPEQGKDQSLMMSDSNADPDVVIVDYGLDKF